MSDIKIEHSLLTTLIEKCTGSLDGIGDITHRHFSISDDRCIATKICETTEYFFASVSRCLDAMRTDWSYVGYCLGCFRSYDENSASQIHQYGIPTTGNFEEWRSVRFNTRTVEGPLGIRVPIVNLVTNHIDLSYDKLYVTALDIEAVRSVIDSLRALETAAEEYASHADRFVSSSGLAGRYAFAIKHYIRSTHTVIMRKIAVLASEMWRSFYHYVEEYDSMYEGNDYLIDEDGLERLIETLRTHLRNIAQEVYEADQCIERLNENNVPVVRLEDKVSNAANQYIRAIISEVNDLTYIEGRGRVGLQQYSDDLDTLYQYADLLGRSCGSGLLNVNTAPLTGLSGRIETRRAYDVTACFERAFLFLTDGTLSDSAFETLTRELQVDPELASRFEACNITNDTMRGMLLYYDALVQEGMGMTDAANKALNKMLEQPGWIEKLYRSASSGNGYLADPKNFKKSAEHSPEDTTRAALEWGKMIANGEYGYNQDNPEKRWGPNYFDCCTFAVCMYTDGAGIEVPHGPDNSFAVHDMYEHMCNYGFSKVPFHNDCSELLPGDILVINPNGEHAHAEVYMGDGAVLHATNVTFNGVVDEKGDDLAERFKKQPYNAAPDSQEDNSGKTYLNNYCEDFNATFGTDITPDNYVVDGVPYVGEISGYRIAKPGTTDYIDFGNRGEVAYVIRYTGGIPVE